MYIHYYQLFVPTLGFANLFPSLSFMQCLMFIYMLCDSICLYMLFKNTFRIILSGIKKHVMLSYQIPKLTHYFILKPF